MRSIIVKLSYLFVNLSLMFALVGTQPVHAAGIEVNSTADNTTMNGQCTLREAVENANNDSAGNGDCASGSGSDVISFNLSGCPCTILLTSEITIGSNVMIVGLGASNLIISGGNANRVFLLTSATISIDQLTITGGAISGSGGGIYVSDTAIVNIFHSVISGNSAISGGGIYNAGGTLTISNSTISNNTASGSGGGVYANGPTATTIITNTTITANSATGVGIGIVNGGTMTIRNSTIANNTAG